jgi:DNA polymerase-3 subunit gamma/tau
MYQVFARKYRPQNFDEIVGQDHIVMTLKNSIASGRLPHALLFSGPRGVGKTTTARVLAKALNCEKGPTINPCNKCIPCKEIADSKSLDVIEIDGASNRGIDDIRGLRENVKYVPTHGRYKVYIIDEVHMLTEPAFNALLKTLEEPPKHTIFILATTAPYKLPLTIISRCQRFSFKKIRIKEILQKIKEIAKSENVEIEDRAIFMIARKADGSIRDAETMLDQLVSYTGGKILENDVRKVLGLPANDLFFKLQECIERSALKKALSILDETIESGMDPKEICLGFIEHLRTLFLIKLGVNIELPTEEGNIYREQAEKVSEIELLRRVRFLSEVEKRMRGAINPDIYLEEAILQLVTFSPVTLEEILKRITQTEISKPIIEQEVSLTSESDINSIWEKLNHDMEKKDIRLGSFLAEGEPVEFSDNRLLIRYENGFHKERVQDKKEIIEGELSKLLGKKTSVVIENKPKALRKSLLDDPKVKKVISVFEGEIV